MLSLNLLSTRFTLHHKGILTVLIFLIVLTVLIGRTVVSNVNRRYSVIGELLMKCHNAGRCDFIVVEQGTILLQYSWRQRAPLHIAIGLLLFYTNTIQCKILLLCRHHGKFELIERFCHIFLGMIYATISFALRSTASWAGLAICTDIKSNYRTAIRHTYNSLHRNRKSALFFVSVKRKEKRILP